MTKTKFLIGLTLLFVMVGVAVVTTNLFSTVSTLISPNTDDFDVYFSNVLVNGEQDLSIVSNAKRLVFQYNLSAVGDKKTITYFVTNASKNYDAQVDISCTEGNSYLKINNLFDTENPISARSVEQGILTIELVNAVNEEKSYEVSCTINASAIGRNTEGNGEVGDPLAKSLFEVGEEVSIGAEVFNVIKDNGNTVTMLAQHNLGVDYKQSETDNYLTFSDLIGWENKPGPKEIDIQSHNGPVKTYVNEYVSYLRSETGDSTLTGTLITLAELKELGCTINNNYSYTSGLTCASSKHNSWISNGKYWWTRSAVPSNANDVWIVCKSGTLSYDNYGAKYGSGLVGVRPVIIISKSVLLKED